MPTSDSVIYYDTPMDDDEFQVTHRSPRMEDEKSSTSETTSHHSKYHIPFMPLKSMCRMLSTSLRQMWDQRFAFPCYKQMVICLSAAQHSFLITLSGNDSIIMFA